MSPTPTVCRNCGSVRFTAMRCDRCGRPLHEDVEYLERVEEAAGEVVSAAYDEYDELRAEPGTRTPLQQAIVELADSLRYYHYEGDGCVDDP
jgi:uncharacterized OB-fold protein